MVWTSLGRLVGVSGGSGRFLLGPPRFSLKGSFKLGYRAIKGLHIYIYINIYIYIYVYIDRASKDNTHIPKQGRNEA